MKRNPSSYTSAEFEHPRRRRDQGPGSLVGWNAMTSRHRPRPAELDCEPLEPADGFDAVFAALEDRR